MKEINRNFYRLIYEDRHMLAVSKEHGVYVIADRGALCKNTLINVLSEDFGKVYTVHRLDAGTGGVMVYAKTIEAHRELCMVFQEQKAVKTYIALAKGAICPQTLMLPIAQGGKGKYKINFKSGKKAATSFIPLNRKNGNSVIAAFPITGRTHQIRVHLRTLKAPLFQDWLYNGKTEDKRLTLFARNISFIHPFSKKPMSFIAPYSDFMAETAAALELSLDCVY